MNFHFYYIPSYEILKNIDIIIGIFGKVIFSLVKKAYILYFHSFIFSLSENITFWITSDFSIYLLHSTSEIQTPIAFLFVNENIKCRYSFF